MRCLKCGSKNAKKNGFIKGKQRYKCRVCGYQYTREIQRGMTAFDRNFALILFTIGLSRSYIAKIMDVSVTTISRLISLYYTDEFLDELRRNRKAKKFQLLKISPKDVIQKMVIQGLPERKLENDAYVLAATMKNGVKIDFVFELPPPQKNE